MINPSLFVMWDNSICKVCGVKRGPVEYVYGFIQLMKRKTNEIIESYIEDKKCNREQAVAALNQFRPLKTLVKVLDEYNYMKYTRGFQGQSIATRATRASSPIPAGANNAI